MLLVSINIRTRNSASTLAATLDSVRRQSYKRIEVLVCDGGSTDSSVAIARSFGASVRFADKLGDARYQNYSHSKGTYVVSIDSDQLLDEKLIEQCVRMCEKEHYDALAIAEQSIVQKNTLLERLIAYDKWIIDQTRSMDPVFGTVSPRFFRKKILAKTKWPKSLSIFDDTILYTKLLEQGAKVGYIHSPCIRHYEVTSWTEIFKKFYRYGKGYIEVLQQDPKTITVHSLPRSSYFHLVSFTKPHLLLGLIVLYGVKACGASLGALHSFINRLFK